MKTATKNDKKGESVKKTNSKLSHYALINPQTFQVETVFGSAKTISFERKFNEGQMVQLINKKQYDLLTEEVNIREKKYFIQMFMNFGLALKKQFSKSKKDGGYFYITTNGTICKC